MIDHSFKVLTFNLLNYVRPPFACYEFENIYPAQDWDRKEQWISQLLTKARADIVGFQEVFSPDALKDLVAKLGYNYFVTVDQPQLKGEYVYHKPVVALASRFPILSASPAPVEPTLLEMLGLKPEFSFNRIPIRAEVKIPGLNTCLVYVVHLKSQRPDGEVAQGEVNWRRKVKQACLHEVAGSWFSSIQRGTEATILYHDFLQQREQTGWPVILLGDFNDNLTSSALKHLVSAHQLREVDGAKTEFLPREVTALIQRLTLKDAYDMLEESLQTIRPATHYYGGRGNVLDYILLSNEFDATDDLSLAKVTRYRTFDRHLTHADYRRDKMSTDHAPVLVELKLRN